MTSIARKLIYSSELPVVVESQRGKNLYQLLNVFPYFGIGQKVLPTKWMAKGFRREYIEVTKIRFKKKTINHGKAWGIKYWNGVPVDGGKPKKIRGGVKWNWITWPVREPNERAGFWH
ncbi:hypothetical protein G9A89_003138 [Geosiphon pyriformis]|nr:hypothetical protein G9A89_003138 [Geosiphon pyriformis]